MDEMLALATERFGGDCEYSMRSVTVDDMTFEQRSLMNCFYCGKYGRNWKCPPNLPQIDYKQMFSEFEGMALLWLRMPYTKETYSDVRSESSIRLHKALLELERYLWDHDKPTAVSFIGGSCKLCRNGCGKEHCNNPYMARSPLEATGLNVIKTAERCGIDIHFPPPPDAGEMNRIGLIAW